MICLGCQEEVTTVDAFGFCIECVEDADLEQDIFDEEYAEMIKELDEEDDDYLITDEEDDEDE